MAPPVNNLPSWYELTTQFPKWFVMDYLPNDVIECTKLGETGMRWGLFAADQGYEAAQAARKACESMLAFCKGAQDFAKMTKACKVTYEFSVRPWTDPITGSISSIVAISFTLAKGMRRGDLNQFRTEVGQAENYLGERIRVLPRDALFFAERNVTALFVGLDSLHATFKTINFIEGAREFLLYGVNRVISKTINLIEGAKEFLPYGADRITSSVEVLKGLGPRVLPFAKWVFVRTELAVSVLRVAKFSTDFLARTSELWTGTRFVKGSQDPNRVERLGVYTWRVVAINAVSAAAMTGFSACILLIAVKTAVVAGAALPFGVAGMGLTMGYEALVACAPSLAAFAVGPIGANAFVTVGIVTKIFGKYYEQKVANVAADNNPHARFVRARSRINAGVEELVDLGVYRQQATDIRVIASTLPEAAPAA